jgi:hypothetical protein
MTDNMETNQDNGTGAVDTDVKQTTQETSKTFTQDELNAIVAKRVAQEQKKFEGIDVEEYNQLLTAKQKQEEEGMMKRQEFDKLLKQTSEKKDSEISRLRNELTSVRVDGALINAASQLKAANPQHVAQLLRDSVKLGEDGQPVVLDDTGAIRYNNDTAEPLSINSLVEEFVNSNPYFKAAGKTGTSSTSNTATTVDNEVDLAALTSQMATDPKARETYRKLMKEGKV